MVLQSCSWVMNCGCKWGDPIVDDDVLWTDAPDVEDDDRRGGAIFSAGEAAGLYGRCDACCALKSWMGASRP